MARQCVSVGYCDVFYVSFVIIFIKQNVAPQLLQSEMRLLKYLDGSAADAEDEGDDDIDEDEDEDADEEGLPIGRDGGAAGYVEPLFSIPVSTIADSNAGMCRYSADADEDVDDPEDEAYMAYIGKLQRKVWSRHTPASGVV